MPYVRERFFKGGSFADLADIRSAARRWCLEVAGQRVHGTTRRQPLAVFRQEACSALGEWDSEPYEMTDWRTAKVHPDHHVAFQYALYSVPSEVCPPGQKVEVRLGSKLVRIYYRGRLFQVHPRKGRGGRSTDPEDYPSELSAYTLRVPDRIKLSASSHGPAVAAYAERLFDGPLPWARIRQGHKLIRLGLLERLDAMRKKQDAGGQTHKKRYAPLDAGHGHQRSDGNCGNGHQILQLCNRRQTLPLLVHSFDGSYLGCPNYSNRVVSPCRRACPPASSYLRTPSCWPMNRCIGSSLVSLSTILRNSSRPTHGRKGTTNSTNGSARRSLLVACSPTASIGRNAQASYHTGTLKVMSIFTTEASIDQTIDTSPRDVLCDLLLELHDLEIFLLPPSYLFVPTSYVQFDRWYLLNSRSQSQCLETQFSCSLFQRRQHLST